MISGRKFDLCCTIGDRNGSCDAGCACCCFIIIVDALVDLHIPTAAGAVGGHCFEARADAVKGGKGAGCAYGTKALVSAADVGRADGFEA